MVVVIVHQMVRSTVFVFFLLLFFSCMLIFGSCFGSKSPLLDAAICFSINLFEKKLFKKINKLLVKTASTYLVTYVSNTVHEQTPSV